MSKVDELLEKAMSLPASDRALLASILLESLKIAKDGPIILDPDDQAELERRLEMIRTGQFKGHDPESVMESIRATLRKKSVA
jgi:putative addiction module component (TIGR02574 family)